MVVLNHGLGGLRPGADLRYGEKGQPPDENFKISVFYNTSIDNSILIIDFYNFAPG